MPGKIEFSSDVSYPIHDAKTYFERSTEFFKYYDDIAFKSYNLDAFERRMSELRSANADSTNNQYQVLASELVIGYNVLHTFESGDSLPIFTNVYTPTFYTYQTRVDKPFLSDVKRALKDFMGSKTEETYTTHTTDLSYLSALKSYVVDSNIPLTEKQYISKYSLNSPAGQVSLPMRAAFNAAPYFYSDFKNFLSIQQKQTLIDSSSLSKDTISTNIEIESLKNTIMASNKTIIYLLLAAGTIAVALKYTKSS